MTEKQQVFISYSRKDGALVTPVVRLLRGTEDLVFMDVDTIQPGQQWRAEIDAALSSATLIVVFWCLHSQESTEVRAEYQAAIKAEKNVLPVLLDSTPVPHELEVFQWVDFRELAGERHSRVQGTGKRKYLAYGCLTAIAIFFLLSVVLFSLIRDVKSPPSLAQPPDAMPFPSASLPVDGLPTTPRPSPTRRTRPRPRPTVRSKPTPIPSPTAVNEPTPLPSATESPNYPVTTPGSDFTLLIILLVIIGAIVGGLGLLMWYGIKKEKRLVADATSVVQEQMSANLEEEIRRRLSTVD